MNRSTSLLLRALLGIGVMLSATPSYTQDTDTVVTTSGGIYQAGNLVGPKAMVGRESSDACSKRVTELEALVANYEQQIELLKKSLGAGNGPGTSVTPK